MSWFRRNKEESEAPPAEAGTARAVPPLDPSALLPQRKGAEADGAGGAGQPAATSIDATMIEAKIVEVLRTCYDPEIPVNIHELGLIYKIDVAPDGLTVVTMTLTSPMCPVAGTLPPEVEAKVRSVPGVTDARVDLVWDPPWGPEMMSEAAKLQLGIF